LWQFRGHKVIAFTATSSVSYERLVHHCICPPTVLKFKSEFELVHGTPPVADPTIVSCVTTDYLFTSLIVDLDKHFELHPVIIITDAEYRDRLLRHLKDRKMKCSEGGQQHILSEVRNWDYGVLLLTREEGRGVDTRFKRDAIVLIATAVSSYHELQQMVGRSCRTRGICEGMLYLVGEERPS